jgi:hypothetical protein
MVKEVVFVNVKKILVTFSTKSSKLDNVFLLRLISHLVSSHPGAGACTRTNFSPSALWSSGKGFSRSP